MLTHRIALLLLAGVVIPTTLGCNPLPRVRDMAPNLEADDNTALTLRDALESGAESVVVADAVAAEPTGWATLTGNFNLNGPAPRLNALKVDKDTNVCAPGGIQVLEETAVVDASGGIKNVLIYLDTAIPEDDPKWEHPTHLENKKGTVIFDQKECIFLSHMMAMRSTQTMRILNSDPVGHNTNIPANGDVNGMNPIVPANGQTSYLPGAQSDRPFPISCSIHPWMSAWLMTLDSPYFAVSAADGSFQIPNVPAGEGVELQFRVWQEKVGFLSKGLTLNGQPATWNKGRFSITLTPDETRNMDVVIDASVFN